MRFVVISDSKGKVNGINEDVLTRILKRTHKLNPQPEFIVICGDSVAGSMEEDILTAQLQRLRSLVRKYHPNILIVPVAGNHEVNTRSADDRFEKVFSDVYYDFLPDSMLQGYNKTVYYKDFADTRLIVANSFHHGAMHKISKEQLAWIEQAASTDKKYKIIFVHSPAFPTGAHLGHCLDLYPEDRDEFWNVVDKCCVDIVFSGHEHNYSRRIIDSVFNNGKAIFKGHINQIITGGGGEKLRDKYQSTEGVIIPPISKHHFVVVDIMVDGIIVSAISSEGRMLDEFKIEK